jgi:hypothetical protein
MRTAAKTKTTNAIPPMVIPAVSFLATKFLRI